MKYAAVILALAVGAFAIPQNAVITSAPAPSATPATGLSPQLSCALYSCAATDVNCKASCLGLARPNASQAIDTNKCAANCDQGDGTAAAAKAFGICVQGCIASLFPSSQTAFGVAGAASVSSYASMASVISSMNSMASASARLSGSQTGSAAAPQATGAADSNSARLAGAGLAGLLAVFVL